MSKNAYTDTTGIGQLLWVVSGKFNPIPLYLVTGDRYQPLADLIKCLTKKLTGGNAMQSKSLSAAARYGAFLIY